MVMYYRWDDGSFKTERQPRPEDPVIYGRGPSVIQDTMEKYYHPAMQKWTESRSELHQFDIACNTITTDKIQPPDPSAFNRRKRERREDARKALLKSVAQIDSGTAPLSEETRELCKIQNDILAAARPGLDPYNAAGVKNNPRGKRYVKR